MLVLLVKGLPHNAKLTSDAQGLGELGLERHCVYVRSLRVLCMLRLLVYGFLNWQRREAEYSEIGYQAKKFKVFRFV